MWQLMFVTGEVPDGEPRPKRQVSNVCCGLGLDLSKSNSIWDSFLLTVVGKFTSSFSLPSNQGLQSKLLLFLIKIFMSPRYVLGGLHLTHSSFLPTALLKVHFYICKYVFWMPFYCLALLLLYEFNDCLPYQVIHPIFENSSPSHYIRSWNLITLIA